MPRMSPFRGLLSATKCSCSRERLIRYFTLEGWNCQPNEEGRLGGCGWFLTHPGYGAEGVWQHVKAGLISSHGFMKLLLDQEEVPLFQMETETFALREP